MQRNRFGFSSMMVYGIIEFLWPASWLWRDGVWRTDRPTYRELGFREGWHTERPPFRELDQRIVYNYVAFSSPHALTVKPTKQVICRKQVIETDTNGDEYEKVTHAKNVSQFGSVSDFMVLRNKRTGEVKPVNVKYMGFGVSVDSGKFILR